MSKGIVVVGAGFSGAVIARRLADAGFSVTVAESRDHVGGNCHTSRDPQSGILFHHHGPHIFHTGDQEVWDYVNRFAVFHPYRHTVRTTVGENVYSLPVNLQTINQFFGTAMRSDEARAFIAAQCADIPDPANFEEAALASIGPALYEAFFRGYTVKQWGCLPTEIPAAVFRRLPLRFNYDDSYFDHPYIGMPEDGYTALIETILDHPRIQTQLNRSMTPDDLTAYDHAFWTGPLDGFFEHQFGRLGYRSLRFEEFRERGDWLGCAVMNFGDEAVPYTRITEHKHLSPWETHDASVLFAETAIDCGPNDVPYYPMRRLDQRELLARYVQAAEATTNTTFVGRLGTYRYIDMDVTIREAMDTAAAFLAAKSNGTRPPVFSVRPL